MERRKGVGLSRPAAPHPGPSHRERARCALEYPRRGSERAPRRPERRPSPSLTRSVRGRARCGPPAGIAITAPHPTNLCPFAGRGCNGGGGHASKSGARAQERWAEGRAAPGDGEAVPALSARAPGDGHCADRGCGPGKRGDRGSAGLEAGREAAQYAVRCRAAQPPEGQAGARAAHLRCSACPPPGRRVPSSPWGRVAPRDRAPQPHVAPAEGRGRCIAAAGQMGGVGRQGAQDFHGCGISGARRLPCTGGATATCSFSGGRDAAAACHRTRHLAARRAPTRVAEPQPLAPEPVAAEGDSPARARGLPREGQPGR